MELTLKVGLDFYKTQLIAFDPEAPKTAVRTGTTCLYWNDVLIF